VLGMMVGTLARSCTRKGLKMYYRNPLKCLTLKTRKARAAALIKIFRKETVMAKNIGKNVPVDVDDTIPELKSVGDCVTGGPFHPEYPRVALKDIVDVTHILHEIAILEDMETEFGTHDSALFLLESMDSPDLYTTICSGQVVVKQARQIVEKKPYPIKVTFTKPGRYWMMK
jgi:hypothetical protein